MSGDLVGAGQLVRLAQTQAGAKVEVGAQTTIYCAVEETIAGHTGRYYSDCRERVLRPHATNIQDAQKLWMESERLTGL